MGIQKLGITFAEQCAKYAKASGKPNILFTNDMIKGMSIKDLSLVPSLNYDIITFSKPSPFSETFVKSLTKIKGKNKTETVKKIKDEILSKMGYKNPSVLEVTTPESVLHNDLLAGGFDPRECTLVIGKELLNLKIEELIPALFHELDHVDKHVKLYKAIGAKRFRAGALKAVESNPHIKALIEVRGFDINKFRHYIDKRMNINTKAYEILSRDVSLEEFNIKKWRKAYEEYTEAGSRYDEKNKYFNNVFEVSAYQIEAEIKRLLGQPPITAKDYFPLNYSKMINMLMRQGIIDIDKQESIIDMAISCSEAGELNKKALKVIQKAANKTKLTSTEDEIIDKAYKNLNSKLMSDYKRDPVNMFKSKQKIFKNAESYISRGLLTKQAMIDDLVKGLNSKTV